ncbi:hypothetical protein K435DRAFT_670055, partial [Dendrothele bispora CBS 962.96]
YFFTQIPQPIHRISEINAILSVGLTSIHSLPVEKRISGCTMKGTQGVDPTHSNDWA